MSLLEENVPAAGRIELDDLFKLNDGLARLLFNRVGADKRLRQVDTRQQLVDLNVVSGNLQCFARLRFGVNRIAVLQVQRAERDAQINRSGIERYRFFVSRDRRGDIAGVFEALGFEVLLSRLCALIGLRVLVILRRRSGHRSRFQADAKGRDRRDDERERDDGASHHYVLRQS